MNYLKYCDIDTLCNLTHIYKNLHIKYKTLFLNRTKHKINCINKSIQVGKKRLRDDQVEYNDKLKLLRQLCEHKNKKTLSGCTFRQRCNDCNAIITFPELTIQYY